MNLKEYLQNHRKLKSIQPARKMQFTKLMRTWKSNIFKTEIQMITELFTTFPHLKTLNVGSFEAKHRFNGEEIPQRFLSGDDSYFPRGFLLILMRKNLG